MSNSEHRARMNELKALAAEVQADPEAPNEELEAVRAVARCTRLQARIERIESLIKRGTETPELKAELELRRAELHFQDLKSKGLIPKKE